MKTEQERWRRPGGTLRTVAHDLALGAVDGVLSTRSSAEPRLNVARSGLLHPVFL